MKGAPLVLALACGTVAPPPPKHVELAASASADEVDAAIPADYITIVDFWSEACGACKVVESKTAADLAAEPLVVVRKVDVADGFTTAARVYDVGALPHWNIYDRRRHLRYVLVGSDCLKAPQLAHALAAE
ncbi:MAG TPA: thioredoxin domain-containing protein [Kofleriaceae bacterium]|nr:thioredoxin domain-containing protein [Kofleriaceae bacterium]